MLFMVIERFDNNDMLPVHRRVRDEGRGLPDGLQYVSSWVEPGVACCFPADGMRRPAPAAGLFAPVVKRAHP